MYLCDRDSGACGQDGVCDKSGCSLNPYRMGYPEYYGIQKTVDTTRAFTVITQFPAGADGKLASYKRVYEQDGVVIEMPSVDVNGKNQNFMNDEYCTATSAADYMDLGATAGMGDAMSRGMVLIFSL